jgi:hypothetical protein
VQWSDPHLLDQLREQIHGAHTLLAALQVAARKDLWGTPNGEVKTERVKQG